MSQIPSVAYANQVIATSPVLTPLINAFGNFSAAQRVSLSANVDQVSAAKSALTQENSGLIRMDYRFSDKSTFLLPLQHGQFERGYAQRRDRGARPGDRYHPEHGVAVPDHHLADA